LTSTAFAAQWTQTTSLPDGWADHSLCYWAGYLYSAGGTSNSRSLEDGTNVFYAQVQSGGTLGAWHSATPLPEAVFNHAGVVGDGYLFVLGGEHYDYTINPYLTNLVFVARINADGSLGAWQQDNPLPYSAYSPSATVWKNTIYLIGGFDDNRPHNDVYSAKIHDDGSISPWIAQPPIPLDVFGDGIFAHASVANGVLYVVGGVIDMGSIITRDVHYTKINADGTLAGWNLTSPLPNPKSNFGLAAAGGRLFAIAGWDGNLPVNSFYIGTVTGDGAISGWSVGPTFPRAVWQIPATTSDSYIFVSGGVDNVQSYSNVYSMPLPPPPAAPTFVSRGFTNGNFQLKLVSTTNTGFGLLASTNLTTWTNIGWGFTGTNGTVLFQDTNAASFPNRFYRAYWPLP
jgi:hypothetical protein